MFIGQARRRFREWFAGARSTSASRKRRSRRSHWGSPRALRVESLEQRELLSVAASALDWKDFQFTSTGLVTGKLTVPYDAGPPYGTVNLPVSVYHDNQYDGAAFDGTIAYTSNTAGTIGKVGSSITGEDAWKINLPAYYNPPPPGTWDLKGGSVISIADAGGKLTGSVDLTTVDDEKYFKTSDGLDLGGDYTVNGSFSTSTLALTATFSIDKWDLNTGEHLLWGSFTYKGTMTPTNPDPFDINLVQQTGDVQQSELVQELEPVPQLSWGAANSVEFDVNIDGPVHTAKSETTPFTAIQVFWAKGPNLSDRISKSPLTLDTAKGSAYKSGIPLYWNQASGHYTITDFLPAKIPSNATNLLFVAKFTDSQGKLQEKVLGTLALPTLSIDDPHVDEPVGATPNDAHFTVTLTTPPGFTVDPQNTVTVQYKILPGTATPNKDYTKIPNGTLTFSSNSSGLTQEQSITVPVLGDSLYDPNETFKAVLSKPSNAKILDGEGVCTIDDNLQFLPRLSVNNIGVWEPVANKTFTVTFDVNLLDHTNNNLLYKSPENITFDFTTLDGTATAPGDYSATSGQLTILKNQTHSHISVKVVGDSVPEDLKTFYVKLLSNVTASGTVLPYLQQQGKCDITDRTSKARSGAAAGGVASRQVAGGAALAAYFDQLGQKKDDEAVDLTPAIV